MSFIIRVVALRNSRKKCLQHLQGLVHPPITNGNRHLGYHRVGVLRVPLHIIGQQATHQADTNFLIGHIEQVKISLLIVIFDGDIATLIKQRGGVLHSFRGSVKIRRKNLFTSYCGRKNIKFLQHFNQIGGRAATEPVRVHFTVGKGIQQAEGIVNIGRRPGEMITVIIALQLCKSLLAG